MHLYRVGSLAILASSPLLACGGDSGSSNGGGASVVSCDYDDGVLRYCNEFRAGTSGMTGCAEGGGTPGTGCRRSNLAGSCRNGDYESFLYGTGVVASAVATVCPDGSYEPAEGASRDSGAAGGGAETCTVTMSGAFIGERECSAILMSNGTIRISVVDGTSTFQLLISGVDAPPPFTVTESSIPDGGGASISVATNAALGDIWSVAVNQPLYADAGTFTLVVDSVTVVPLYNRQELHGTLDAVLPANPKTEATGTVTVHVDMP